MHDHPPPEFENSGCGRGWRGGLGNSRCVCLTVVFILNIDSSIRDACVTRTCVHVTMFAHGLHATQACAQQAVGPQSYQHTHPAKAKNSQSEFPDKDTDKYSTARDSECKYCATGCSKPGRSALRLILRVSGRQLMVPAAVHEHYNSNLYSNIPIVFSIAQDSSLYRFLGGDCPQLWHLSIAQKCQLSRTAAESPAKSQGVPRARASQGHRGQVGSMQVLFSAFFFAYFSRKAALPENVEIKGIVTVTSTLGNAA